MDGTPFAPMKYVSGYSSAIAAKVIVRLVEGVHLIRREEMAELHLTGQHHARAVGLFETSLNHRTRCCKSPGIGVPVFLPNIRAHCAVMSAIEYRSPAMNGRIANWPLSQCIRACACLRPWCAISATCERRSL